MAETIEQGILIRVTAEGGLEVKSLAEEFAKLKQQAEDAAKGGVTLSNSFADTARGAGDLRMVFSQLGQQIVGFATGWIALSGAVRLFMDGIKEYNAVTDITRAIGVMSGSTERATQVMAYFNTAAEKTRMTATELARLYQEVLPLAMRQGWGPSLDQMIVKISQVATLTNRSTESLVYGFQMMMRMGPSTRNPLLQALGITAEDLKKSGDGVALFMKKLDEMAAKGADAGQSFESSMKKIRDAWTSAIGRGFQEAAENSSGSMDKFIKEMENPEFLKALENIALALGKIAEALLGIVKGWGEWLNLTERWSGRLGEEIGSDVMRKTPGTTKMPPIYSGWVPSPLVPGDQAYMDAWIAAQQSRRGRRPGYMPNAPSVQGEWGFGEMFGGLEPTEFGIQTGTEWRFTENVRAAGLYGPGGWPKGDREGKEQLDVIEKAKKALAELQAQYDLVTKASGSTAVAAEMFDKELIKQVEFLLKVGQSVPTKVMAEYRDAIARVNAEMANEQTAKFNEAVANLSFNFPKASEEAQVLVGVFDKLTRASATNDQIFAAVGEKTLKIGEAAAASGVPLEALGSGFVNLHHFASNATQTLDAIRKKLDETTAPARDFANSIDEVFLSLMKDLEKLEPAIRQAAATMATNVRAAALQMRSTLQMPSNILFSGAAALGGGGVNFSTTPEYQKIISDVISGGVAAWADGTKKGAHETHDAIVTAFQEGEQILQNVFSMFGADIGSIFQDLAETGGKNFGEIAARSLTAGVGRMGEQLWKSFSDMSGITQQGDYFYYGGRAFLDRQAAIDYRAQDISAYAPATVQGLAGLFMLGTAISQGGMTAAGALMSGAQLGMSVGGTVGFLGGAGGAQAGTAAAAGAGSLIGAGIGLIIGAALYFALKPDPELVRYFTPELKDGIWTVIASAAELTPSEIAKYQRELQTQWDAFYNTYASILADLPLDVLSQLSGWIGDAINMNAMNWPNYSSALRQAGTNWLNPGSAEFAQQQQDTMAAWNEFIEGELPRETMETFRPAFSQAFQLMGGTLAQFNEYWNYARTLNPDEAAQYIKAMMNAMSLFHENAERMATISDWRLGQQFVGGRLQQQGESEFLANLQSGSEQLFQIAAVVASTFGPVQAMAAEQLGEGIQTVLENLEQYLTHITQLSEQLNQSIEDMRFQAGYSMIEPGNRQGQSDYLMREYNRLLQLAQTALDPDKAYDYYQRAANIATQIWQLDPRNRYDWYMEQLDRIETLSEQTFQRIGDAATSEVQDLLTRLEPFVDFFTGMPVELEPAISDTITAFEGATDALLVLKQRIESGLTTPAPAGGSSGGAPGTYPFGNGSRSDPYRRGQSFDPTHVYQSNDGAWYEWGTPPLGGSAGGGTPPPETPPGAGGGPSGRPKDYGTQIVVHINGPIYDGVDLANKVITTLRRNPRLLERQVN